MTETVDVAPVSEPQWGDAVRFLEQAVKAGNQDANTLYLLAMAYKHQRRLTEARQTLAKIADPDANVRLQRGLLAFQERDFASAEVEFRQSWDRDSQSYPAGYNLMLALMCQGKMSEAVPVSAQIISLAPSGDEQRFLGTLRSLLVNFEQSAPTEDQQYLLSTLTPTEEQRLLDLILGLSPFEVQFSFLSKLVSIRSRSMAAMSAYIQAAIVQGKNLMDRCLWEDSYSLLSPLKRRLESMNPPADAQLLVSLCNLLGVGSAMVQDFDRALQYFQQAKEHFQRDFAQLGTTQPQRFQTTEGVFMGAWIEQNLALVYEWQNKLDLAETYWHRYLDFLEQNFGKSLPPSYLPDLAFETCSRLADLFSKKQDWTRATNFLHRAHRIRPNDFETLERLFQFYTNLRRVDDARRVLRRLREVRPNDPQAELFELEVREIKRVQEAEELMNDLRRVLQRYPNDTRVEERASILVTNMMPALERLADNYSNQLGKVVDQMRRLPSYQINWPTVNDIMDDLEEKYALLRKVASKALNYARADDARRELNRLVQHCDRKIDQVRRIGD